MGTPIGDLLIKKTISLDYLKGRIVGVDAHNILYQFLSSIRNYDGSLLMDSKGQVTSHLTGLIYRITNLILKEIKPVFVFDGKPSKLKLKTLQKRSEIRTEAEKLHKKAIAEGKLEEAKKMGQKSTKLTKEMIIEAKKLLQLMGLPVIEAPSEGEAQAAYMCSKGDLFGIVSQDYDSLLFGCPKVFRNITISGKRKLPGKNIYIDVEPQKIELQETLQELGISREKLIWIGILVGTDFNDKFPKIGPKTAIKLVREHNSFEDIISKTGHKPDFDYKEIEKIFLKPKVEENHKIEFGIPNIEKVKDFLCNKHDFSENRVENVLNKLTNKLNEKSSQNSLQKWF